METNFNLGSLKIVYAPLMEYFKQAQKNVVENLVLVRDEKKVPLNHEAIGILGKVQKTLKMIGLTGISTVLSLTEEGLIGIREVKFDTNKTIKVLEMSEKILKNISFYIQSLVNAGTDQPTKFFDDYKALADLLNKEVEVKDLFNPKLEFRQGFSEAIQNDLRVGAFINDTSKSSLLTHLGKVQANVREGLTEVLKVVQQKGNFASAEEKNKYQAVCKQIYDAFEYAQKLKISKNFYILFGLQKFYICVLSPVFNEQFKSYVETEAASIKNNLNKTQNVLDKLIEVIGQMEEGEKTGMLRAEDDTVKDLVYELIKVVNNNARLTDMPVYQELYTYFDLDSYSVQLIDTKIVFNKVMQNQETIQQIERLFTELKEDFTLLENKKGATSEAMAAQLQKVISVNTKLTDMVTPIKEIHPLLSEMGAAFTLVKSNSIELSDLLKKEISLALVLTEYGINTFIKNTVEERYKTEYGKQTELQLRRIKAVCEGNQAALDALPLPMLDSASQKSDEKKAFAKIFEQISTELSKIEETLDNVLRNEMDGSADIDSIYKPFSNMKGIFSVIGKPALSQAVDQIIKVWREISAHGKEAVDKKSIEESVALTSGLSLFVNAFKSNNEVEAEEIYESIINRFTKFDIHSHEVELTSIEISTPAEVHSFDAQEVDTGHEFSKDTSLLDIPGLPEIALEAVSEHNPGKQPVQEATVITQNVEKNLEQAVPGEIVALSSGQQFVEEPNDADLAEIFLMEAEEVLGNLTLSLASLEKNLSDKEELTNVRRYFHTLKGSGRMVGLEFMGEAGWMTEQTLNKCLSGELAFDVNMFSIVKDMKGRFDGWIRNLQETNKVTVDLVSVKKMFLNVNPSLTNHIDINMEETAAVEETSMDSLSSLTVEDETHMNMTVESPQTIELEESTEQPTVSPDLPDLVEFELQDQEKPEEPTVIEVSEVNDIGELRSLDFGTMGVEVTDTGSKEAENVVIEGHEVSSSLFDLFEEESVLHIAELKNFVHSKYVGKLSPTEEFMRHAHTLASISRTVHMSKIAQVAAQIESITNVAMDKEISFSQKDLNTLRHAIDNIDLFKKPELSADNSYFDSLVSKLEDLYNSLNKEEHSSEHNIVVESIAVNSHGNEPRDETQFISQEEKEELMKISEILENSMKDLLSSVQELQKDVSVLKKQPEHSGNTEQIVQEVMRGVALEIEKQYSGLKQTIAQEEQKNREAQRESSLQLMKKVDTLEEAFKQLKKSQQDIEKSGQEHIESVKKDIRILGNIVKKSAGAPKGFFASLFGKKDAD